MFSRLWWIRNGFPWHYIAVQKRFIFLCFWVWYYNVNDYCLEYDCFKHLTNFNCHNFYLLSVAAKLVAAWSAATMFYGKKYVISALWYFPSKGVCSHQICFCPFTPWKCTHVVTEQCNNTSCTDILCSIMHHCTLLFSRTGCKLNCTAVHERRWHEMLLVLQTCLEI